MKKFSITGLLLFMLAGCATPKAVNPLPSGNRVIWVKDLVPLDTIEVDHAHRRGISDKIALMLDSRLSHKFSAIYRFPPPKPETSIVVTGIIVDFGPGSTPNADQGSLSMWMQQFGAGRLAIKITVIDAATNEKLIDNAEITYPIYEDIDFFGWTRLEQTINIAVEKIARSIGKLSIKKI